MASSTSISTLLSSMYALAPKAHEITMHSTQKQKEWNELRKVLQHKLGLQSIYKVHFSNVSHDQIYDCLLRLLSYFSKLEKGEEEEYYDDDDDNAIMNATNNVAGQHLGITSSGQYCHIADDGSI